MRKIYLFAFIFQLAFSLNAQDKEEKPYKWDLHDTIAVISMFSMVTAAFTFCGYFIWHNQQNSFQTQFQPNNNNNAV